MDSFDTELELTVGDTFQVGGYVVTVIDTDGDEVSFRVDDAAGVEAEDDQECPELPGR